MRTRLLVLTKHFPFNMGETAAESYLETEIGYLAEAFDAVLVVATASPADRPIVQAIPDNVCAVSLGFVQTALEKARALASGTLFSRGERLAMDAADSERALGVIRGAIQRYFIGKATRRWHLLKEFLAEFDFEPTHIYSFWFFDTALLAVWVRQSYPCARAVARAHGYDLYRDRNGAHYLPCREYLLGGLDAVLPCSQDGTDYLSTWFPAYAGKIRTAYLGTRELPDKSAEPKGRPFHVVSCSRAVPVKRLGLLCDALALLDAEGFLIAWTHYGNGPDLTSVMSRSAAFSSVHTEFPGNVSNEELLTRYAQGHMDLFVNVSSSEGLPISIMEASGHGVPVLATDVGGTHEIVRDGLNGRLLPEGVDATSLSDAIRIFCEMPDAEIAAYRRESRRIWGESFRAQANVDVLLDALRGGC